MEKHVNSLAQHLLNSGLEELPERERRVIQRIAKRLQVSRNINREYIDNRTFGQRLSDQIAEFGGSWTFIIGFFIFMMCWAVTNSTLLFADPMDPFPYIFLNLVLSMVAALQAPVIMMSQNRQGARDRLAAASDYEINLKAELEIMGLHEKLDQIRVEHLEKLVSTQQKQIDILTKIHDESS